MPFGSQSGSDTTGIEMKDGKLLLVFIAFRQLVRFGLRLGEKSPILPGMSSLPFGSQSGSDDGRYLIPIGECGVFIAFRQLVRFGQFAKWSRFLYLVIRLHCLSAVSPVRTEMLFFDRSGYTLQSSLPFGSQSGSDTERRAERHCQKKGLHCLSAVSPVRTATLPEQSIIGGVRLHCLSAVSPVRTTLLVAGLGASTSVFIAFRQLVRFGLKNGETIITGIEVFIAFRQLVRFGPILLAQTAINTRAVFIAFRQLVRFGRWKSIFHLVRRQKVFIAFRQLVRFGPTQLILMRSFQSCVFIAFRQLVRFGPAIVFSQMLGFNVFIAFRQLVRFGLLPPFLFLTSEFVFIAFRQLVRFGHQRI